VTRGRAALVTAIAVALACAAVAPSAIADPAVPAQQRRAQIKKRIQALRAAELTTQLDLDGPTAARLTALLDHYDDDTDRLVQKRVELTRKLQGVTPNAQGDADRLVDEALDNEKAFHDLQDRRIAEIRKLLTPVQTAKLLVVLPEFERRIQNQLRNAIQNAPNGKRPRDPDDD
jgi:hypothetical protein